MNSLKGSIFGAFLLLLITNLLAAPLNSTSGINSNNTNITGKLCGVALVAVCPDVDIKPTVVVQAPSGTCFSGDSWIDFSDGRREKIDELRRHDTLFAFDGSTLLTSEVIMMLDSNRYTKAIFYTLQTKSNHTISLSPFHLIPIISDKGILQYLPAKNVTLYDNLYVLSNEKQLIRSPIVRITIELKIGYFAPLTMDGTLFVNNVLASCFSNVHSHKLAQLGMTPLRWHHTLSRFLPRIESLKRETDSGIHWIPQIMLNFAQQFYPSILQL